MKPKIVVVDDEVDFLGQAKHFIFDADIIVFDKPAEALVEIPKIEPIITITDVMMPGIHGLQFIQIATSIIRSLNLIVISANTKEDVERKFGS